ncbi:MAG: ATP-binding protein [Pseudomonadota bacterium]
MNPWHKRANEFIRDPAELLPLIAPQPIHRFFEGDCARLFDRLVVVIGAPGSGKTTLARLLELPTLLAMREFSGRSAEVKALVTSLSQAGVLDDLHPTLLALRLPAGGQLRAIWELPYEERLRHRLLRTMIQAKAVLGWLRQMEAANIDLSTVKVQTIGVGDAARDDVGADNIATFRERARSTERAIFKLVGALVPPTEAQLGRQLDGLAYEPFAAIEAFEVQGLGLGEGRRLRPMLILDDAHELHPTQLGDVDLWLRDREVKVARWILTRADSLDLSDFRRVLSEEDKPTTPGTQPGRDRIRFLLQDQANRDRSTFRSVAEDVAKRYLAPLAVFNRSGTTNLRTLLNAAAAPELPPGDVREIESDIEKLMRELNVSAEARHTMEGSYPQGLTDDVRAGLTRIMLNRELRRTPQRSLFGGASQDAQEVEEPKRVNRAVATGAELQLLDKYDRPFYYGFDRLAEAANENIEQFVTLASVLVDNLETQIIRGRPPRIDARHQHKLLREHARNLIAEWDFPYAPRVRKLVSFIAERCLDITLRPNAPLDDGANAYGVLIGELTNLDPQDDIARVIHYALAYQALVLVEPYDCKGKTWGLLELGGVAIIAHGLPFSRGGFAEGTIAQLRSAMEVQ